MLDVLRGPQYAKCSGPVKRWRSCFKRTTIPSSTKQTKSCDLNQEGEELNETMIENGSEKASQLLFISS